jgi:APA family basic amino acid/polyamine antiporter
MEAPTQSQTSTNPPEGFRRELRVLDATMIVVGSMIGSGIFIVSADIARTVGSAGYLLLVWLITGVITVAGALCYGELAGMFPRAGGQYLFLRESYNPFVAFLYGWTFFTIIQTGTIAAVAVAFAKYTAVLLPGLANTLLEYDTFRVTGAQVLAIGSILILTFISTLGIRGGKILQDVFTFAKLAALIGVILIGVFVGRNAEAIAGNVATFWNATWTHVAAGNILSIEALSGIGIVTALGAAMVGALFSSDAWNNITFAAAEVVEPRRTIPLSLVMGTGIVVVLYLLANIAYLMVLPVGGTPGAAEIAQRGIQFATEDRVATAAASLIFGETAALIMAALIMVSTFGCNNGLILAGARVYYAMAKDGLFFRSAGSLNRHAVPATALWVQALWASLLCLSGTYGDLLDYVIFAVLIFYILTVGGIFVLRRRLPDADRPYRVWAYPVLPALYMCAAASIAADLLIFKPSYTIPGVGIVLLGIPVYFAWRRSGNSSSRT